MKLALLYYITNHIRVLSLPEKVLEYLRYNKITVGHAKLLINLNNSEEVADKIVKQSLNVRQAEKLIKDIAVSQKTPVPNKELKMLESKISESLGMHVKIIDNNDSYGIVKVTFKNLKDLEEILKRLS